VCILGILLADVILIGADWQKMGNPRGIFAILLFACASLSFSFYAVAVKKWNVLLMDIVVWIPIINFIAILPIWLCRQTGIPATPLSELLLQAIFQGVVVTLFAGFLIAYTIKALGPITTTMFMASVPGVTALLGYIVLNEQLTTIEVASVVICMIALMANSRWGMTRRFRANALE
jgi:drug/metabolite transporter (DMT)-like permease